MSNMGRVRTATALFRATLAVVFGFMSLSHGPVMAFARTNAPLAAHGTMTESVAGHHHHAAPQTRANDHKEQLAPQTHEGVAICYSAGCFLVMPPVLIGAPAVLSSILEQLHAAPARALVPTAPDPLVPPPRLQA
jgi:hypothetical protein